MGMFDSFVGEIKCPRCGKKNKVEIQFKWGECMLHNYELGDYVDEHMDERMSGYDIECDDAWPCTCDRCGYKFTPAVILRNGQVVRFTTGEYAYDISNSLDDIPKLPEHYAKIKRYKDHCKACIGLSDELLDFKIQPLKKGDKFNALHNLWEVTEGYKKTIKDKGSVLHVAGMLCRKQDLWYVYKVRSGLLKNRWAEVFDLSNYIKDKIERGNVIFSKTYDFEHAKQEGYEFEKLF